MYLVTEMFKNNDNTMVKYTEIESGYNSIEYYDIIIDKIRSGMDKRNWFNLDENGYKHGDINKLPGAGEFGRGNRYFVIGRIGCTNRYICFGSSGIFERSKIKLGDDHKNGLLINANVNVNGDIRLNRGTLLILPAYHKITDKALHNSLKVLKNALKGKTEKIDVLFNSDGTIKEEWILPVSRGKIKSELGSRDIKNLCINSTRLGFFLLTKNDFSYNTSSGPMLTVHKAVCANIGDVIAKYSDKDKDELKKNTFMVSYTYMLTRIAETLNYS